MPLTRRSVLVLNRIRNSKGKTRNVTWTVILTVASICTAYHTLHIFSSELDITKDATTKELSVKQYAVTFCVSGLKNYQNSDTNVEIPKKKKMIKTVNLSCGSANPPRYCDSYSPEEDIIQTKSSISDYVDVPMSCKLSYTFNNSNFGLCGTFNIISNVEREIMFYFRHKNKEKLVMVVHEEGASPVFTFQNIISLTKERTYTKIISKIVDYRMSWWVFPSLCVSSSRTIQTWNVIKSHSITPEKYYFKYSQEACLDQCLHQLTKKYCRCILSNSMIDDNAEQLPLCSRCNDIPEEELNSMCGCKPPCQNVEFQVIKKDFVPEFLIEKDPEFQKDGLSLTIPTRRKRLSEFSTTKQVLIDNYLIVTEKRVKEFSINLEILLSLVGCAWNMWLGFSFSVVISITIAFCFTKVNNTNPKLNLFLQNLAYNTTLLLVLAIFIAQAYLLIQEYLKFKVEEVVSRDLQSAADFPTTYVCFPDNTYRSVMMNIYHSSIDTQSFPKVWEYIASCEFQTQTGNKLPCRTQVTQFPTEEGLVNCASVRPKNSSQDLRLADLQMELKFIAFEMIADATRMLLTFNPFAGLHTSVVRLPVDQIYVSPGDALDLQFSLLETRRLPEPYSSKCKDESSNYTMWQERVRDIAHHIKYTYNFEDCLFFCLSETKDIERCGCQLPCRDFEYKVDIIQKQDKEIQKFLQRYDYSRWQDQEFIKTTNATVRIRQPLHKKISTEKAVLDLINLSSQLGGLSMFWLGMPLLALNMISPIGGSSNNMISSHVCR